jgi:hypothetical protein
MGVSVNQRRKEIVKRVREEGRQAALAGRNAQTNPHRYMDGFQWMSGYQQGLIEAFAKPAKYTREEVAALLQSGTVDEQRAEELLREC